jgi:hypothetical protein
MFLKSCCKKNPFDEKVKMSTKGPFVVESFVTIGSFDCVAPYTRNYF